MSRRAADRGLNRLTLLLVLFSIAQGVLAAWLAHRALFSMTSFNDFLIKAAEDAKPRFNRNEGTY
jgi:hypothetical protein